MKTAIFAAAILASAATGARAEWYSDVRELGFGEKRATAVAGTRSLSLFYGCESNKVASHLRIATSERVSPADEAAMPAVLVSLQISIDDGEPIEFSAALEESVSRNYLVSAALDYEEGGRVGKAIANAKKSIAFRAIFTNSGATAFGASVSASGSRKAAERVAEVCAVKPW